MSTETITATDLTVGEYVGTGTPIVCHGQPMELTLMGTSDDWECGTCFLAVVVEDGRVDSIGR
ncbi:hypothetical protein [Streptomyces sp. NBC_01264]|uniref:hypothetical protein n=1 Tax=Streptomyces sp. NBC_01264 TaxID=2903804 RepID=UPI00224ECAB7|nr:hypothetical protein [Streptomyces sp. NBC_01264]MCX4780921.1 hypothetical protein [Streptomyces sp. NBC_01264]